MKSRPCLLGAVLIAAPLAFSVPVAAQFAQYTAPGQALYDARSEQERLDQAIRDALWHLGRVAIDPYVGLSDLSYLENRSGESGTSTEQWTVSATAGLRAYIPVGSKTTIAAFALPEYVWFEENGDASRLNQRLGLGIFTFLNRLGIQLKAGRVEDLGYVTNETPDRVSSRADAVSAELEIPVGTRISVVADGAITSNEYDLDEDPLLGAEYSDLDNDASAWRAGLRFYPTATLSLTAAFGESDTDFAEGARDRSNSGDSWGLSLAWTRPKSGASIAYQSSNLEPKEGSEFEGFEGETWNGELSWVPRDRFSTGVYFRQNLSYTLDAAESFFVDERFGLRTGFGIGWRLSVNLFAEQGTLDYSQGTDSLSDRKDDLTAWGAEISFPLGRRFRLSTGFRRTEVESDLPGAGYRLDEIVGTFGFGGGGADPKFY